MEPVEFLKMLPLMKFFTQPFLHFDNQVLELHAGLDAEERTTLTEYATQLEAYLKRQSLPIPDRLLLELACFIPGIMRGIQPPLAVLSASRGGFSERRLHEALGWLRQRVPVVEAYRTLPAHWKRLIRQASNLPEIP